MEEAVSNLVDVLEVYGGSAWLFHENGEALNIANRLTVE